MREIIARIHLIVRIGEVIHPTGGVRIDVHDIRVQEVIRSRQRTLYRRADDTSRIVDIGRILRDDHLLLRIHLNIRIQVTLIRIQTVAALHGLAIVIDLIAEVQLSCVDILLARDRVRDIQRLYDALQGALVVRVTQTLHDDGVHHVLNELMVLCVGYLRAVHIEVIH